MWTDARSISRKFQNLFESTYDELITEKKNDNDEASTKRRTYTIVGRRRIFNRGMVQSCIGNQRDDR